MVLGMLVGAGLLLMGYALGVKTRPEVVEEKDFEAPRTLDGKYFSTKIAIREAMGRGEDD